MLTLLEILIFHLPFFAVGEGDGHSIFTEFDDRKWWPFEKARIRKVKKKPFELFG